MMMSQTATIYLYAGNQTFQMPARKFAKLVREMRAGRGGSEIMDLVNSGYEEFLAADGERYCIDGMTLELLGVA
jgi:hypothetical protein